MLEDLFALQKQENFTADVWITEAWTLDAANHGHAAILNQDLLERLPDGIST